MAKRRKYRNHKIAMSESFKWMIPYLSLAWNLGLPINKIKSIKGFSTPASRTEQSYGWIRYDEDGNVRITIRDAYQVRKGKNSKVIGYMSANQSYKWETTLYTLAHELTHLRYYDHTEDRLILEGKLIHVFAKLAKRLGYKGYK